MSGFQPRGESDRRCDEVAELARRYLDDPRGGGLKAIDSQVGAATDEARWDDLSKWHRVRLRYLRLQQQRDLAQGWPTVIDAARAAG